MHCGCDGPPLALGFSLLIRNVSASYHAQNTTLNWIYLDFQAGCSMLYWSSDVLRLVFTTSTRKFDFRFRICRLCYISKWMTDVDHLENVTSLHLSFSLIIMASPLIIIRRGSALLVRVEPASFFYTRLNWNLAEDVVCVLRNVVTCYQSIASYSNISLSCYTYSLQWASNTFPLVSFSYLGNLNKTL